MTKSQTLLGPITLLLMLVAGLWCGHCWSTDLCGLVTGLVGGFLFVLSLVIIIRRWDEA